MFRKINDCIWGGNDRLCSLNRGKRVLFTVSAGWTRHSERDKYRRRHNIYCTRYVDCAIYRGGVVARRAIDRAVTDAAIHQPARYLRSRRLIARRSASSAPPHLRSSAKQHHRLSEASRRPLIYCGPIARRTSPAQSRRSFIFISRPQLDGSLAAAGAPACRRPPLRGSNTPHRRSVNFVMSKVNSYATQVASRFWISLKVGRFRYGDTSPM